MPPRTCLKQLFLINNRRNDRRNGHTFIYVLFLAVPFQLFLGVERRNGAGMSDNPLPLRGVPHGTKRNVARYGMAVTGSPAVKTEGGAVENLASIDWGPSDG